MLTPHSLRFDTPEGLLNFLLWALLVVFADSLDFYKYARHVEIPRVYEDRLLRSRLRKEFKYVMMEELPRYYAVTLHQTACNLWTDVIAEMVMNFSRAIISFHDLKFSKRDGKTPATAKLREAYLTREMLRNRLEKDVRRLDRGWVAAALAVPNSPDSRKAVFFYDWPIKVSRKGRCPNQGHKNIRLNDTMQMARMPTWQWAKLVSLEIFCVHTFQLLVPS